MHVKWRPEANIDFDCVVIGDVPSAPDIAGKLTFQSKNIKPEGQRE
jgi:hypothetical protein